MDDGGSAVRIIVIRPAGESVAQDDEFVLDYIQNLFIANFKKYTAINASAEISAENIAETETAFLLIGKLSRTGNTYVLDIAVTDPVSGLRKASYLKSDIQAADILSAQAINEAFMDIVSKLNVKLSEEGIAALQNPTGEEVQAAINLARGSIAEKNGNPIEMLTYFYNASQYDPKLLEAGNRFEDMSRMLSAGDVGASVKGDFEDRNKWKTILDEFDNFYHAHPPFILTFNPHPMQKGQTDYDQQLATLEFEVSFQEDVSFEAMRKVFASVASGLESTGNQETWGFAARPYRSPLFGNFRYYTIRAEMVNDRDEVVAATAFQVRSRVINWRNTLFADTTQKSRASFKPIHIENELTGNMLVRIVSIDDIETEQAMQNGYIRIIPAEILPQNKMRNPVTILTRNIFDK